MNEALQQLIDLLKNVAPHIWQVAVNQVLLNAHMDYVWGWICVGIMILFFIGLLLAAIKDWDKDFGAFCFGMFFIFIIPTAFLFTRAYQFSHNPEWYAIQLLISTATGR